MINIGGYYSLLSQYYREWEHSEAYKKIQERAFENSKAARFLRLCYKEWEKMPLKGNGIIEDHACLILEPTKLTSQASSFTDAVKLACLWIEPGYRRKGLGRSKPLAKS
jgi:hypothetical protein